MKPKKQLYSAPALEKGLDILEHLAATSIPQSQADLTRALGRTQGEIYRMLECLVERGYVQRDEYAGTYRLTLKLYALGRQQNRTSVLRRIAALPMERLAEETGQSCHLSMRQSGSVVVVMERLPTKRVCLAVGEGAVLSPYCSSGLMLLSREGDATLRRRELEKEELFKALPVARRKALIALLEAHVGKDVLLESSPVTPGGVDLVTTVGLPGSEVFAALAMPYVEGTKDETMRAARTKALKACAAAINQNLGI